jgi:hypothetical protein
MILIVVFLTYLASYLSIILEAKFGKAKLLFIVVSRALIYILLSLFYNNANLFY